MIPAAGLGTRFLPATKANPRRCSRSSIARPSSTSSRKRWPPSIDDILIITGRNKRAIENHFDRNVELEYELRDKNPATSSPTIRRLADLADIHYVRQGEPLGLGHVSVARNTSVTSRSSSSSATTS